MAMFRGVYNREILRFRKEPPWVEQVDNVAYLILYGKVAHPFLYTFIVSKLFRLDEKRSYHYSHQ